MFFGKFNNFKSNRTAGFTLIELLVVVAIIGMLTSVISLSLSDSRRKSRDAKRLSDMQETKTGLELYYNSAPGGYPDTVVWNDSVTNATTIACSGTDALRAPRDIVNVGLLTYQYAPGGSSIGACGGTVWETYKIQFTTEGETALGNAGTYYLSPAGFTTVAPF